ncbi:MAG: hypothetical protein SFV54_24230 [Bryobacteraceae bacterium]|nr:hypothetical protein [Bryobacteraceae bacterium]
MTDHDRLLAGYATGSLTDEERKALFAAALEDQELFNALGEEDALRDLLAQPGVKQRLMAAMEEEAAEAQRVLLAKLPAPPSSPPPAPERQSWWRQWMWPAAALAAAAVVGVAVYLPKSQPVTETAQSRPVALPAAPQPTEREDEKREDRERPSAPAAAPARLKQKVAERNTQAPPSGPSAQSEQSQAASEQAASAPPPPAPQQQALEAPKALALTDLAENKERREEAGRRQAADSPAGGVVGGVIGGAPPPAGFRAPAANMASARKADARLLVNWRWERQSANDAFQPLAAGEAAPPAAVLRLVVTSPGGGTLVLVRGAETLVPVRSVIGPAGTLESLYLITAGKPETLRLELRESGRLTNFEIPVPVR